MRPTFVSADMLQAFSGLPLVGEVSMVSFEGHRWSQNLSVIYVALTFVFLGLVFGGVFLFEVMGPGLRAYL